MYKCFDQLIRELVYEILRIAGMPAGVLDAYARFLDQVQVHNTVAGGWGKAFQKRCSIPQGCPWSMMVIALMLRPWILIIREKGAQGRVLADDILVTTEGNNHAVLFEEVYDSTHEYLLDMGAKIASAKSMTFSSNDTMKRWLKGHRWR